MVTTGSDGERGGVVTESGDRREDGRIEVSPGPALSIRPRPLRYRPVDPGRNDFIYFSFVLSEEEGGDMRGTLIEGSCGFQLS